MCATIKMIEIIILEFQIYSDTFNKKKLHLIKNKCLVKKVQKYLGAKKFIKIDMTLLSDF